MGFFFKNKKKNKTEETMAQAPEVTTETTTADGMILSREGIKGFQVSAWKKRL